MNGADLLAILGGIATVAAALKAAHFLLQRAGAFLKFTQSLDRIPDIASLTDGQEALTESLTKLTDEVRTAREHAATTADIEVIVNRFNLSVDRLTRQAAESDLRTAITTFKAHTVHCPTASYIISTSTDGKGVFVWANPTWYEMMGIDEAEARNNQWWNSIAPEDAARVAAASATAAAQKVEFSVTYRHINLSTQESTRVHVQAWPLVVGDMQPEDQILFLGAIKTLGPTAPS